MDNAGKASRCDELDAQQASELLPIARFDDAALIGYEPDAGFADPYLVASAFAKAARRLGAKIVEGVEVQALLRDEGRNVVASSVSKPRRADSRATP